MTMSFLSSFIKALVLSLGIWGAGPNEKSLGHWGCALKGDLGSLLSVICSLAMMTVVFFHQMLLAIVFLIIIGLRAKDQLIMCQNLPKCDPDPLFLFINGLFQVLE